MYEVEGDISLKDTMIRILSSLNGIGSIYLDFNNKFKALGLWATD